MSEASWGGCSSDSFGHDCLICDGHCEVGDPWAMDTAW